MENQNTLNAKKTTQDLLPTKFGKRGVIWTAILILLCLIGLFAYYRQLRYGLVVTHMGDYVSWGIYISNFVFFVAISLVGSLVTAIFRLGNIHWSTPLTRIAEIIAVSAILFASFIIIVDMGRPERACEPFYIRTHPVAYHVGCDRDQHLPCHQPFVAIPAFIARPENIE